MRLIIPLIMIALFMLYVLYLAFIKKELRKNIYTVVFPGLFFIGVWGIIYSLLIR